MMVLTMNKDWVKNARDFFGRISPGCVSGKLGDKTAAFWDGFTPEFTKHERNLDDVSDKVYGKKNEL